MQMDLKPPHIVVALELNYLDREANNVVVAILTSSLL